MSRVRHAGRPRAESRGKGRRLPRIVWRAAWDDVLAAATCLRDRALIAVMLFGALRVSEAVALDVPDVDLNEGRMHIRHGKGDKEGWVYLNRKAVTLLRHYLRERGDPKEGPIFVTVRGRLSRVTAWRVVKAAGEKAGVGDIWPHVLRHSCATGMLEKGANLMMVRDHLRHEDLSTTQIYLHIANPQLRAAVDEL